MSKLLIASGLILAAALPVTAGEVVPGVGQISRSEGYSASVCTNDPSGKLALRNGPGQHHDEIQQIPSGRSIRVLNTRRSQDGFDWFKISYKHSRGWVRSDYVCNSLYNE
ncbi:SH3 domain-containing protein [Tolypothrix sp. FACHB-123]|uniref:SH3 domain-containing protein n=1 Tax=Tolypothrix sp. FACHB-123 TaxID=2692868 RepID=UPI0016869AAF|nr:SH3 domain-containing protein [Tolypothrix sp. FACHB-123]MBD2357476.1 SH3 domain-containing protein [Tolypothrix sp. FACHB-123]